jgi:hypothetical protein
MEKVKQQEVLYGNINKNLIGIHGRIGSGKDTVGNIILFLLHKEHLKATDLQFDPNIDYSYGSHGFQIRKMAGKLKQIASILTGISAENFESQEFKKMQMHSCWGMTYREFLQKIGTDAMRNGLHEDTWLNAFWVDYKPPMNVTYKVSDYSKYPKWIITDIRFENEYNSVKEREGLMIKVERPGIETQSHASETGLDHITDWDWVIQNDGTIEDLISMVKDILKIEKIL